MKRYLLVTWGIQGSHIPAAPVKNRKLLLILSSSLNNMWGVSIFRWAATTTLDEISVWLCECAPPLPNHTHTHSPAPLASSWAWLWSHPISFRSACSLSAWTQRGSSINFLAVFFSVISCSRAAAGPFPPTSIRLNVLTTLPVPAEQVVRWAWGVDQLQ